MISQNTIQQIQSQTDIIDVVGAFVKLKKRGANYLGLCPFHHEKTPSFTVSPAKEIYKCFGCGKSGNAISFLMDHEKYSYVEALKWLAQRYNIDVEETFASDEAKQQQQVAESLYIVNSFATDYFKRQLNDSDDGQDIALTYLSERGFYNSTIEKFEIGYAPGGGTAFTEDALKAQYSKDILIKSGLCTERNGTLADNYRNRIVFPIHNQSGKVIGFGARVIGQSEKGPKYINTPENEIYVKSRILYGMYFSRQAIDKQDECLLVEGYTDVVSLHQAGVENVVASGGTSLTPDQLRLIKKFTNNLTILYDGDSAGVKAALRGLDLAIEEGLNVQVVLIPDNEDPDSYVRKTGAEQFRSFIQKNKKDFILFQVETSLKNAGNDVQKKSEVVNRIAETIARLTRPEDFIRRQHYITQVSQLLSIDEAGLINLINKHTRDKLSKEAAKQSGLRQDYHSNLEEQLAIEEDVSQRPFKTNDAINEEAVIRALIEFGPLEIHETTVAEYIFTVLDYNEIEIENAEINRLYTLYRSMYAEGKIPGREDFIYHEDRTISETVCKLLEIQYDLSPKWQEMQPEKIPTREDLFAMEVESAITYLLLRKAKVRLNTIRESMHQAEQDGKEEEMQLLLGIYNEMKKVEMELTKKLGTVILK